MNIPGFGLRVPLASGEAYDLIMPVGVTFSLPQPESEFDYLLAETSLQSPILAGAWLAPGTATFSSVFGLPPNIDYEGETIAPAFVLTSVQPDGYQYESSLLISLEFVATTYESEDVVVLLGGDTDFDNDVDFADFIKLSQTNLGDPGDWTDGDFDGDGLVTFADFLILSKNWTE